MNQVYFSVIVAISVKADNLPFSAALCCQGHRNFVRAPHLTELSHRDSFITNSAGLLFLLLRAAVFISTMPGFSAHSCFSSALVFSLLKRCFCKMQLTYFSSSSPVFPLPIFTMDRFSLLSPGFGLKFNNHVLGPVRQTHKMMLCYEYKGPDNH